jgi:hypothetical protein
MIRKGDSFWNYKEHVSSLINQPGVNLGINIKEFSKLYGSQTRDKDISKGVWFWFLTVVSDGRHKNHYGYLSSFVCLN